MSITRETNSKTRTIKPLSPHPAFSPDEFREDIRDLALSVERENRILEDLWHIMCAMVDLGYGVENVHTFFPKLFEKTGPEDPSEIEQTVNLNKGGKHG